VAHLGILVWLGSLVGLLVLSRKSKEFADRRPPDRSDYRRRFIRWITVHAMILFVIDLLVVVAIAIVLSGETNCGSSCGGG
jgi:hypothetical protein